MSGIEKRLPMLFEMHKKHFKQLCVNQSDPAKDKTGSATNSVVGTLRFLAVADYVLNKDIVGFRSKLSEAAGLRSKLFNRFDAGEAISPSYVSMITYKALFNALAAGDLQLANELATHMGGRNEIERKHDHPFDLAFGYVLKSFVLEDAVGIKKWLSEFKSLCDQPENAAFKGYAKVFEAILDHDAEKANVGFSELLVGHKHQSKKGVFKDTEDEMLCVWGIGLANLAYVRGITTKPQEPLIPADLLI